MILIRLCADKYSFINISVISYFGRVTTAHWSKEGSDSVNSLLILVQSVKRITYFCGDQPPCWPLMWNFTPSHINVCWQLWPAVFIFFSSSVCSSHSCDCSISQTPWCWWSWHKHSSLKHEPIRLWCSKFKVNVTLYQSPAVTVKMINCPIWLMKTFSNELKRSGV